MKVDLNFDIAQIIGNPIMEDNAFSMQFDYLKTLKMRKRDVTAHDAMSILNLHYREYNERDFNDFMTQFPNVDFLDISSSAACFHFSVFDGRDPDFEIQGFHAVKKLKTDTMRNCAAMKRIMTFPNLETLEIVDCDISDIAEMGNFGIKNDTLRHLIICYKGPINIGMWTECLTHLPTVIQFEVTEASTGAKYVLTRNDVEQLLMTNELQ